MRLVKNMEHLKSIKLEVKPTSTNRFINALAAESAKGYTDNGAVTYTDSGSPLLDFYAQAGAMRHSKDQALDLFKKAFAEDRLKAIRILFYLRDVRGGQGERDLFRTCLEWLGTAHTEVFEKLIKYVPEYGRWDDLFFDNEKAFEFIYSQLLSDSKVENPSLLAKWLPTANASSPKTRAKAAFMAKGMRLNIVGYRKAIRAIRKKIKVVEELMSARKWEDINYSAVPSQASRIYKNAFAKHDEARYAKFIEKAETGEVKINAATLYPYQIYKTAQTDYSKTLEALWNQLPDYTQGRNALVVADVSGSMIGYPMAISVSLALYFAERNKGQFKDYFLTFSAVPTLQQVRGVTLMDRMNSIQTAHWDMNTNLQAVFDLILKTAVKNNTPVEEMPETIYIISDMEFDEACNESTNHEVIEKKYSASGYKVPNIVYWNVNASGKNLPVRKDESGVSLVSGFSPVIFKLVVEGKTAEQVMLDTINSKRYAQIEL